MWQFSCFKKYAYAIWNEPIQLPACLFYFNLFLNVIFENCYLSFVSVCVFFQIIFRVCHKKITYRDLIIKNIYVFLIY